MNKKFKQTNSHRRHKNSQLQRVYPIEDWINTHQKNKRKIKTLTTWAEKKNSTKIQSFHSRNFPAEPNEKKPSKRPHLLLKNGVETKAKATQISKPTKGTPKPPHKLTYQQLKRTRKIPDKEEPEIQARHPSSKHQEHTNTIRTPSISKPWSKRQGGRARDTRNKVASLLSLSLSL